jgi:Fe-S cluster assembly protein SufD
MSAVTNVKQNATDARLSALSLPKSGWSAPARVSADARLWAMGVPGRRDEYWKYTDPTSFNLASPIKAALFDPKESEMFSTLDRLNIVFVDGEFSADLSDPLTGTGLEIARLADIADLDVHWAKEYYGVLEERGQSPVQRPLAALNTAYAMDGVIIHVTGTVTKPVNITYLHRSETSDAILHHVIKLDAGAELTVLENGPAAARLNKVMEVFIADDAKFHHVRTQGRDHERRAVTHIFAELGAQSVFKSFTLTANGVLTRNECILWLNGDDGIAHVAGACVGDGDFHHDDTVFITHDAVGCESRQVFKKVLRNGATGVFQGKILVKPGAQKTDGYQISQSLLLDDDSQFLAKPELEIYADDVACSHGSTSGAIDEEALYYLRSRGVPQKQATNLLTLAFLGEAVDEVEDRDIADALMERLEGWLQRHNA